MSRIRTDLKPTIKDLKSSTSSTKSKIGALSTVLPPVSSRCSSASHRHSVDMKWNIDMVRGYTLQTRSDYKSSKNASENKLEYEKLLQKCVSLQKLVSHLREQLKLKNKAMQEMEENNAKQVDELKEKLKKCERTITEYNDKTETRFHETKSLQDIILENNKKIDELNKELSKTKQKYNDFLVQNDERRLAVQKESEYELMSRDNKISLLKMQLESALMHKSKERQRQIDELTKELNRVTGETEFLKSKIRSLSQQKPREKCENCVALEKRLELKIDELQCKDDSITELLQHGEKMAKQLAKQDEILKLCERAV